MALSSLSLSGKVPMSFPPESTKPTGFKASQRLSNSTFGVPKVEFHYSIYTNFYSGKGSKPHNFLKF
jgi:hypothetical protein